MAYENLLKSVDESAQEREQELRQKAQSAVQAISKDTRNQAEEIQQSFLAESKKAATIERNKRIYLTKGENKETLIKTKERIVSKAFHNAEQRLAGLRNDPKYPAVFRKLAQEVIESVGGEEFRIHIDKRDEEAHEKNPVRYESYWRNYSGFWNVPEALLSVHEMNR